MIRCLSAWLVAQRWVTVLVAVSAAVLVSLVPSAWVSAQPSSTESVVRVISPGTSAPLLSDRQSAAYRLLRGYLNTYQGSGFAKVTSLGDLAKYRQALVNVRIVIDPKMTALASYDPGTNTMRLSRDPASVPASQRASAGQTIWHELTHKIEDVKGDWSLGNKLWDERHVEHMTLVADKALQWLRRMEVAAERGAPPAKLAAYWDAYLRVMEEAGRLPESVAYPPNTAELASWFGFSVDTQRLAQMYASGRAGLSRAANDRLREAFAVGHPRIAGTWLELGGPNSCPRGLITFTQATNGDVTAASDDLSACSGAWSAFNIRWLSRYVLAYDYTVTRRPPGWTDGSHQITFAPDGRSGTLVWQDQSGNSDTNTVTKQG
jgi:hypothetical protein